LTKDPAEITIGDIITIMEGPIALVDCLLNEADSSSQICKKAEKCVTRSVWERVCQSISEVLNSITLADLCKNNCQKSDCR
jgi:DNA-binding IscR family transcriptional regulator